MARRQGLGDLGIARTFKGRQFAAEVILWATRWYLMFPISYRDLELMLQDRGVEIAHTTTSAGSRHTRRSWRSGSGHICR
jgi:IS6 family transposase